MKINFYRVIICSALLSGTTAFSAPADSIVVDSDEGSPSVVMQGSWVYRAIGQGNKGTYDHDGNEGKGTKSIQLIPDLPINSNYNVYLNWVSNANRASNVPITISYDGGSTTVSVNQQNTGDWVLLGTFPFAAGTSGSLLIETTGTDGYVIADAAAWVDVGAVIEVPEINVIATVPSITEGNAASSGIITLTRSGPTDRVLNIPLDITGSATPIDDYAALAENNVFPIGETARTFLITPPSDGVAEGDESIIVTVLADAGYTLGSDTVAQLIIEDSPFDLWRAEKFTPVELANTNVSSGTADPDGDDNNNLGEFFADSNPKRFDAGPELSLSHDGTNILVHLPRNPAASELEVGLTTSADLKTWWSASKNIVAVGDDASPLETLTYTIPANGDTNQFWGALIGDSPEETTVNGVAFWSFDTMYDGRGASADAVTYVNGLSEDPVLSAEGTALATSSGGAASYFGPDGNSWSGSGDASAPGHSLAWSPGSQNNRFSIEIATFLQEDIKIRFDLLSSVTNFSVLSYDTGTGPLPVPAADLGISADGEFHEWAIDLSAMDAVNGRSSIRLTWAFEDLSNGTEEIVQIDNVAVSSTGRAKTQLIRNLKAGRLQTVVTLGTSITANGAWVDYLSDSLETNYHGLATVLNSGASGKTSAHGVANINSLVLNKAPDTMFIEYSINDSVERFAMSVADARANLEYIIDTTLASYPRCEIILMTMTPGDKYEPGHTSYRKDIEDYYAMYRAVARERGFLAMDHYSSWIALQTNDVDQFNSYVPDTIHPGAAGNEAVVLPALLDVLGISGED